jgi:DNA modification methylase
MPKTEVYAGDAASILGLLPERSVQTCITSPPYYGLRDYGVEGQIGNEDTPEQYADRLVRVFRGVRRILRDDGTLWLNLGDSYARNPKKGQHKPGDSGKQAYVYDNGGGRASSTFCGKGFREKSLIGIPWRVAFALMADGWILRNEVIWHKPNGMTEAAHDRITRAHEQVFLFSKSPDYYFDDVAIMEPTTDGKAMRQKRDVWTIPVARFKGAHFAVFPDRLVEPMVLSSTSPNGACAGCGLPCGRVVSRARVPTRPGLMTKVTGNGSKEGNRDPGRHVTTVVTLGFDSGCSCMAGTSPHVVLDPFLGSGTTAVVANRLGRDCIGIELNADYAEMARRRIGEAANQYTRESRRGIVGRDAPAA